MVRLIPCFLLLGSIPLAASEMPLPTFAELRALSQSEAAKHLPVLLTATVVYSDPKKSGFILHDGTAGCFVSPAKPLDRPEELRPGTRVRIRGFSNPITYFPDVINATVEVLGQGEPPAPRQVTGADLFSRSIDSEWVEVPAVVVGVETGGLAFTLVVEIEGVPFKADIPFQADSAVRAAALMQRKVRLRGVVGTVYNRQRQLTGRHFFVPSFDDIIPFDDSSDRGTVPTRKIGDLLQNDLGPESMVRVRGVVTQMAPNGIYLRDDTGSTFVHAADPSNHLPGTDVEVDGFPSIAPFRPELRATRVTALGRSAPPQARPFHPGTDELTAFHSEKVAIDCALLATRKSLLETVLQCQASNFIFEAFLPLGSNTDDFQAGDRVLITGICEVTTTHPMPRSEWADGFRLHLAGADAVKLISSAPWWTIQKVLFLLTLVVIILMGGIIWNHTLRRQVAAQAQTITSQIKKGVLTDERQRIARELHDTLDQELTGLSMQLGNLAAVMENAPAGARESLALARRMLRLCRENSRTTLHDLRNVALLEQGLPATLRETLIPPDDSGHPEIELSVTGSPRRLPATAENHLLHIAREAVANARKHAAPSRIAIQLRYRPAEVSLEIHDDGCGFDPTTPPPVGHFGILGIRERANKIHAQVTIDSSPGAGCRIFIRLENQDSQPANPTTAR